ncbi:MAG: hypothetical protein A2289_16180 [Deltaproteobacteria bacterium RIFOXYA12_FULL_58_15]|nr:MAG: hypothetical protein A2289_16180 [Deltaproteobacteria bacterium RIFOXYA12_FULL_58_15]
MRLDRVQVIWLTLGCVVALGLMFALGVVVGRRAASFSAEGGAQDPVQRADAVSDLHNDKVKDELKFYGDLTGPAPKSLPAAPVPEPRAPAPSPSGPVGPSPSVSTVPSAQAAGAGPAAVGKGRIDAALAAGEPGFGEYTIQVSSYQSMGEARAHSSSLERKGFKPFIVTGVVRGTTWYRVRIGRFADMNDASEGKQILNRADIQALIVRND